MSTTCLDLTFLPCAAWLKSELTESIPMGKPEKLIKELKVQGFWRQHRVALFSWQLTWSFHSIWVIHLKNISTKTSKHILFLTFLAGFKIIALYISSEVYDWLKQKANLQVLTERWLNCISSRNNVKTTNHTTGGLLKPLCTPSLSGQIPALRRAGGWIVGEGFTADQQQWGVLPPAPCASHGKHLSWGTGRAKCIRASPYSWRIPKPAGECVLGRAF